MLNVAKTIASDIADIVRAVMSSETGVNRKVGKNTLKDSELFRSVRTKAEGDIVIDLLLNDYVIYVESGRRKGAKMPPPAPIADWCRRKGLPADNSTVFAICRAIARDGIAPRPVMAEAFDMMDSSFNWWGDIIFEEICGRLDEYFNE